MPQDQIAPGLYIQIQTAHPIGQPALTQARKLGEYRGRLKLPAPEVGGRRTHGRILAQVDPQDVLPRPLPRGRKAHSEPPGRRIDQDRRHNISNALVQPQRRVRSRLSAVDRKKRTRRLIVLGSLMEKEVPSAALLSKLDATLDRDQDRALFGLPPKSPDGADRTAPAASAPLEGWRPGRLPDGSWGSLYAGPDPEALPQELAGLTITVRTRSGKSWDATITEVAERTPDRVLVRTRRLDQ